MNGDRELDVVVFGATGFAGRLVAGYLAGHVPAGVGVGLAGRSERRLAEVRQGWAPPRRPGRCWSPTRPIRYRWPRWRERPGWGAVTAGPYRARGLKLAGRLALRRAPITRT